MNKDRKNKVRKTMLMTLLYTVLALVAVTIVIFFANRDAFWQRLAGDPDLGKVDFATLERGKKPNEALVCPKGFCPNYENPRTAPEFALSADELIAELQNRISEVDNASRVDDGSDPLRLRFVTVSPLMRYPDTVNIEAVPLEAENGNPRSSVAMFAKAKLGTSDMGANRKRLNTWLDFLNEWKVN